MGTVRLRRAVWLSSVLLFFLFNASFAADKVPNVERTWFPNPLSNFQYFDDSDCVLTTDTVKHEIHRSTDGGSTWKPVTELGEGSAYALYVDPRSKTVAVALGRGETHYITRNRGEKWHKFEIEGMPAYDMGMALLSFHADYENSIIFNTRTKEGPQALYTTDGFESIHVLKKGALQCMWAKEQVHFASGDDAIDKSGTLCVVPGRYANRRDAQRLLVSDNFFEKDREPALEEGRPVAGVGSIVAAKGFLLAARQGSTSNEMALYVTKNTKRWHRAYFGGAQLIQSGYTIMESTNYSLQVDVSTGTEAHMGRLFTSNSNGRSFVENEHYTNKNSKGFVDFEQIANIQGIAIVNIVSNGEEVLKDGATKQVRSQYSFDDGRSFADLKVGDESLHLHSVTEPSNVGKVFSSLAPGIAMGIGNTGPYLKPYEEGNLYVSDDAGRTWWKGRDGPHKYEFGDQGSVLLAVPDSSEIDEMYYSLDRGHEWPKISFQDYPLKGKKSDVKVKPLSLTTAPDSTTLKFLLLASAGIGTETVSYVYTIDFGSLDKRKCEEDDLEEWYARVNKEGNARCIMGHKQKFMRRKEKADCFILEKFKDPTPTAEHCPCYPFDWECDADFRRSEDGKTCEPVEPLEPPSGACKKGEKNFMGPSGFRLIPGNTCKVNEDLKKTKLKKVERPCPGENDPSPPSNSGISHVSTKFPASAFAEYYYLERSQSSEGNDETVIMRTKENDVWISHDHGKHWGRLDFHNEIKAIYPHMHMSNQVYLITPSKTVHYSKDRGKHFEQLEAPAPPNGVRIPLLRFHPTEEDWLIWMSCKGGPGSGNCNHQAHVSTKNGMDTSWKAMLSSTHGCEFVWREGRESSKKLVYCMQRRDEDPDAPIQLLSSEDWFDEKKVLFKDMLNFAVKSEFLVVATKEHGDDQYLKIDASLDGKTFADAKLPSNLQVHHSNAYTVLDSSTHSIFLHVTMNQAPGQEYGTIVKSNSNGTFYVKSLDNVNRNSDGYADFEKMFGLEGVAVANVIANVDDVVSGSSKKLKSMITYDDGATWNLIKPPREDAEKKKYKCGSDKVEKCSLHLHGFTERVDPRDTYSSPSAVGIMIGVGNVGEFLKPKPESDTFISRDGGTTWKAAKNGQFMWEFGDRGSVIVLVEEDKLINVIHYSLDEGENWESYKFSEEAIRIIDISTVPSDTSRNFLLWAKDNASRSSPVTINLDFSGLASKKCQGLNRNQVGSDKSDYELWEPKHPDDKDNKKRCLFGHVSQFIRKKTDRKCFNPQNFPDKLHEIKTNCSCTRQDFECGFNFERQADGSCKLIQGEKPREGKEVCNKKNVDEWYEPTGYRKLELSTCKDGRELEFVDDKRHPCPGKEDEFNKKHGGISGAGLFFAIVIPIAAAAAVGWWMWRNLDGRFGRIRLGDMGDSGPSVGGRNIVGRQAWAKYPIMIVSAAVAVVMAIPMLTGVLWRNVRERMPGGRKSFYSSYAGGRNGGPYTSRDSFSRGGRDYSDGPHNDERDLLGEDSDDDI